MDVIFSESAMAEVRHAGNYYESEVDDLGKAFLSNIENGVKEIERFLLASRVIRREFRRFLAPRFPYVIIYRDGSDLSQLLSGKSDPQRIAEFLNHYPHPRRGKSHFFTTWRQGNWKVGYDTFAKGDVRYGLYNLASDPSESQNLAARNPEKLRSLMQGMVRELESMDAVYPVKNGRRFEPVVP